MRLLGHIVRLLLVALLSGGPALAALPQAPCSARTMDCAMCCHRGQGPDGLAGGMQHGMQHTVLQGTQATRGPVQAHAERVARSVVLQVSCAACLCTAQRLPAAAPEALVCSAPSVTLPLPAVEPLVWPAGPALRRQARASSALPVRSLLPSASLPLRV